MKRALWGAKQKDAVIGSKASWWEGKVCERIARDDLIESGSLATFLKKSENGEGPGIKSVSEQASKW